MTAEAGVEAGMEAGMEAGVEAGEVEAGASNASPQRKQAPPDENLKPSTNITITYNTADRTVKSDQQLPTSTTTTPKNATNNTLKSVLQQEDGSVGKVDKFDAAVAVSPDQHANKEQKPPVEIVRIQVLKDIGVLANPYLKKKSVPPRKTVLCCIFV